MLIARLLDGYGSAVARFFAVMLCIVCAWNIVSAGEVDQEDFPEKPANVTDAAFRFRGGEKIKIFVPATVGDSFEQIVTSDGMVMLPTGGAVCIMGKTIVEAQSIIKEQLEKESGARRVYAAIAITDIPVRKVYIGGEVRSPTALPLAEGMSLTLAAALAASGGPTGNADLSKVSIVRTAGGKRKVISVDASGIGRPGNPDVGPELEPGDVVIVPMGDVFILAGEVNKPGAFNRRDLFLEPDEPARISRVLFAGGGLKPNANRKDIRIIRTLQDGSKKVIRVNLDASLGSEERAPTQTSGGNTKGAAEAARSAATEERATEAAPDADPVLLSGDIVLAGGSGGVAVLGKVRMPGVFPLVGETLKLSRAIAMAGGFAEFAKTSSVVVIRASAPRQPIRIDINEITKEGNLDKDLDLGDGDLVFVGERLL
jgi:polysaccharide export outer membrane protein